MEKFFSVMVETTDGQSRAVAVRGQTPGEAFAQVKSMPDVRRVGKVTEVSQDVYDGLASGRLKNWTPAPTAPASPRHGREQRAERPGPDERTARQEGTDWKVAAGLAITGPRVVRDARPTGGEQPFKHLQAPPERLGPPAPEPKPEPVKAKPVPSSPAISTSVATPATAAGVEYRIVKSRRQGGQPYLLQRGRWDQPKGKRVFVVEWEQGFDERAQAEQQMEALAASGAISA